MTEEAEEKIYNTRTGNKTHNQSDTHNYLLGCAAAAVDGDDDGENDERCVQTSWCGLSEWSSGYALSELRL